MLPFGVLIASCDLIYEISHIFILRQAECNWILPFFSTGSNCVPYVLLTSVSLVDCHDERVLKLYGIPLTRVVPFLNHSIVGYLGAK